MLRWISNSLALILLAALCLTAALPGAHAACSNPAGVEAEIVYNTTSQRFQYCDDINWIAMTPPGSGSGGCANPVRAEGTMVYNPSARVMQGCAGNVWRAIGPIGGAQQWVQISAGSSHACGIKSDGTAWCWGLNDDGQLGDGGTAAQAAPVAVSGGATWKAITVGSNHTCGIRTDDTAWCWGTDDFGQLGNGATTGDQTTPQAVTGGYTWKSISAASNHTCGIQIDDTLWCWGSDAQGQLGNGATTGDQTSPVQETSASAWKQVSAGGNTITSNHTCALKSDDTLWCWGSDFQGQLGNGATTGNQDSPVAVSGGGAWKHVEAGVLHTCALKSDESAWCWGSDSSAQLGNGATTGDQTSPVAVNDGGATWKDISADTRHTCGIKSDDSAWCWGSGLSGELGNGDITQQDAPVTVSGSSTWKAIRPGDGFTCGIRRDGTASCWGWVLYGRLGNGSATSDRTTAVEVLGGATWNQISTGTSHTCGIQSDNTAWCWGDANNGKLGNGATTPDQTTPVAVSGGGAWKQIAAGSNHTCGIKSDDTAWCWGQASNGKLGNGATTPDQTTPVAVSGGGAWKQIAAGSSHTCGIKTDDTAWCWGSDTFGQLGNGATTGNQTSPVAVSGGGTWKQIAAGNIHVCGIKTDDTAWCWGSAANGRLGNGATTPDQTAPVAVSGGGTWKTIDPGNASVCGIKSDNTVWCWGSAANGRLGNGATTPDQTTPVAISGGGTWNQVSASQNHTCAIAYKAKALCWGTGSDGQLGNNFNGLLTTPQQFWCGAPGRAPGTLLYNSSANVMQYCDGAGWVQIGAPPPAPSDPCAGSPSPGDVCADGSVYAGLSPDGNVKMYTTPADAGPYPWNNGNSSGYVTTSQTNATTGETNTNNLITIDSDSGAGGTQPHQAAQYCADLNAHGQTDWHLPAKDELNVLYTNKAAIGGFNVSGSFPAGYYWSSSENDTSGAWLQRFSDGLQSNDNKPYGLSVRCVRK